MPLRLTIAVPCLLGAVGLAAMAQQSPNVPQHLEPGKPLVRQVAVREIHPLSVELQADHLVRFSVQSTTTGLWFFLFEPPLNPVWYQELTEGAHPTVIEFLARAGGTYTIRINARVASHAGTYDLKYEDLGQLDREQIAARDAAQKSRQSAAAEWAKKNAIPLTTVEPGHGFADLQALKPLIGNARILAVGEGTHGTSEFFRLRQRLFEFLVEEMGFTLLGIETTMSAADDLNRYVLSGEGDPMRALAGGHWIWNIEEVLDLVGWMRRYNADPRHSRKLKIFGLQEWNGARSAQEALHYLRRVDPDSASEFDSVMAAVANPILWEAFEFNVKRSVPSGPQSAKALLARLDGRKAEYVRRSSAGEWADARQKVRNLACLLDPPGYDQNSADAVAWMLEQEGPGSKAMLAAHNAHVSYRKNHMGEHLRKLFGGDYVSFGFAFYQGGFGVRGPDRMIREFSIGPPSVPPSVSALDSIWESAGHAVAAFPFRQLPKSGLIAEWFDSTEPWTREFSASYPGLSSNAYPMSVTRIYDGMFFVRDMTPSRRLPSAQYVPHPVLAAPSNLGFEDSAPGQPPADWVASGVNFWAAGAQTLFGFEVSVSEDSPRQGRRCALVSRAPGIQYGNASGGIVQRVDASPYRGKRIRLRAAVRTDVTGEGNQAHLWIRVDEKSALFDGMLERPIVSRDWHDYEVAVEVPRDAGFVEYGLALVGAGRAWLDAVSIEMVEPAAPVNH